MPAVNAITQIQSIKVVTFKASNVFPESEGKGFGPPMASGKRDTLIKIESMVNRRSVFFAFIMIRRTGKR